jgi:hypothetical protein
MNRCTRISSPCALAKSSNVFALPFLHHASSTNLQPEMDFRTLDRMPSSDESFADQPYRPFYSVLMAKPVIVKQSVPSSKHASSWLSDCSQGQ